jgi:hypothetical protein
MWLKQCHKPPIWDGGHTIPHILMVMSGGWFIVLPTLLELKSMVGPGFIFIFTIWYIYFGLACCRMLQASNSTWFCWYAFEDILELDLGPRCNCVFLSDVLKVGPLPVIFFNAALGRQHGTACPLFATSGEATTLIAHTSETLHRQPLGNCVSTTWAARIARFSGEKKDLRSNFCRFKEYRLQYQTGL